MVGPLSFFLNNSELRQVFSVWYKLLIIFQLERNMSELYFLSSSSCLALLLDELEDEEELRTTAFLLPH